MMKKGVLFFVAAIALAACTPSRGPDERGPMTPPTQPEKTVSKDPTGVGNQIGDGSGRTVTTIVGTLAGAYIGGDIGSALTDKDKETMISVTQKALEGLPAGQTARWTSQTGGPQGSVTPQPSYRDPEGQVCREYQETITAKGDTQTGFRSACRKQDGSWRIVGN